MAYPFYGNNQYIMQDLQNMRDRIDNQMRQVQQQGQQQVPQVTQNFQLAPSVNSEIEGRYANNIDEVKSTFVIKTGIFVNKDFTTLWVKDVTGKIRTFNTEEVVEMDEKDREILLLKKEIEEMKGMISHEYDNTSADEPIKDQKSAKLQTGKRTNAK